MKKTYISPAMLTVELASRDALLLSASATRTLSGTSFGGTTSTPNGGGSSVSSADVKEQNVSDVNLWDKEW